MRRLVRWLADLAHVLATLSVPAEQVPAARAMTFALCIAQFVPTEKKKEEEAALGVILLCKQHEKKMAALKRELLRGAEKHDLAYYLSSCILSACGNCLVGYTK